MYEFEFHYKSKEEPEKLWEWCYEHLRDSFYFRPKHENILDAKYNPMTMIEDYIFISPKIQNPTHTIYVEIKNKRDAATFKITWENIC